MLPPCPHRPLPSRPLFGCRAPPSCPSRGGGASNCAKSIPAEYPRPPGAQKAARRLRFAGAAIRIIYKYKYDNNTRFYAAAAPYRRRRFPARPGKAVLCSRARSRFAPPDRRFCAQRAAGRPATSIPHSAAPCRGRGGKGRKAGLPAAALVISGCPRGGQKAAGGRATAVRAAVSPARFPPQSPIFSAIFEGNRPILAKS